MTLFLNNQVLLESACLSGTWCVDSIFSLWFLPWVCYGRSWRARMICKRGNHGGKNKYWNLCVRLFSHNEVKKCLDLWVLGYPSCTLVSLWAFSHYFQCIFVSLSFIFLPIAPLCSTSEMINNTTTVRIKVTTCSGQCACYFFPLFHKRVLFNKAQSTLS